MEKLSVHVHAEIVADQTKLVGQCMEYDIVVQGDTKEEIIERFFHAIRGHLLLCKERGEEAFSMLPKGGLFKVKSLKPQPTIVERLPFDNLNTEAEFAFA